MSGNPLPDVNWIKVSRDQNGYKVRTLWNLKTKNSILILSSVSNENIGTYMCIASNVRGAIVRLVTIKLLEVRSDQKLQYSASGYRITVCFD